MNFQGLYEKLINLLAAQSCSDVLKIIHSLLQPFQCVTQCLTGVYLHEKEGAQLAHLNPGKASIITCNLALGNCALTGLSSVKPSDLPLKSTDQCKLELCLVVCYCYGCTKLGNPSLSQAVSSGLLPSQDDCQISFLLPMVAVIPSKS